MKRHGFLYLVTGIVLGGFLFNAVPGFAAGVTAAISNQPVTLNGKPVQITAYLIEGSNYFKLRDIAAVLDIGVWYDAAAETVRIEPGKKYDPGYTGPSGEIKTEGVYKISDYYNADGKFSSLGQALPLDSKTGDRMLTVKNGDTLVVGETRYKVTADSLNLFFYTQPSMEKVFVWWAEYMESWLDGGKVEKI